MPPVEKASYGKTAVSYGGFMGRVGTGESESITYHTYSLD